VAANIIPVRTDTDTGQIIKIAKRQPSRVVAREKVTQMDSSKRERKINRERIRTRGPHKSKSIS
jgi:hypothetical protein